MAEAIADRKVDLRDLRRDPGDAHAPAAHDAPLVWPKIMALRKKAQCQAKETYDKELNDLDKQLCEGAQSLPASSGNWTPSLSSSSRAGPAHGSLNGDHDGGRPARGPRITQEKQRELQERYDYQQRQQALFPLSYYMAEIPPPADRERLSAAVLLELQSRFGVITDEEIAGVAGAAHNEFAIARIAE